MTTTCGSRRRIWGSPDNEKGSRREVGDSHLSFFSSEQKTNRDLFAIIESFNWKWWRLGVFRFWLFDCREGRKKAGLFISLKRKGKELELKVGNRFLFVPLFLASDMREREREY